MFVFIIKFFYTVCLSLMLKLFLKEINFFADDLNNFNIRNISEKIIVKML